MPTSAGRARAIHAARASGVFGPTPRTPPKALARRSSSPSLAMWRSIASSMASRLWVSAIVTAARLSRTIGSFARSARQHSAWRASTSCLRRAASAFRRSSARNVAGGSARLTASAELGRLSGKQIAALVGLAPQTHESGKKSRQAKTGYGRPLVRSALFNAARAAIRHPSRRTVADGPGADCGPPQDARARDRGSPHEPDQESTQRSARPPDAAWRG